MTDDVKRGRVLKHPVWRVDPDEVDVAVEARAQRFRRVILDLLRGEEFELPPLPAVAQEILVASSKPNVSAQELARIAHKDAFVAGRVLRVANAAHYGFAQPAANLQQAIVRIGASELRNIVFVLGMKGEVFRSREFGDVAESTWHQSIATALAATAVAALTGKLDKPRAFLAGLMHNVGAGIVIKAASEYVRKNRDEKDSMLSAFPRLLELLSPETGALTARRWNLDPGLQDAIRWALEPQNAERDRRLAYHVGLGCRLAQEAHREPPQLARFIRRTAFIMRPLGLGPDHAKTIIEALPDKVAEYESSLN